MPLARQAASASLQAAGHLIGDGGGHAGEIEDIDALEDLVPVKDVAFGHVDGRELAVVDAAVAALRGADLKHIAAKTVALTHDARCVDAVGLQRAQSALAQTVGRDNGDVSGLVALVGQGKRGVGFGAAVADSNSVACSMRRWSLGESLIMISPKVRTVLPMVAQLLLARAYTFDMALARRCQDGRVHLCTYVPTLAEIGLRNRFRFEL